ncbi:uncharacterized protein LOC111619567 [Centruroides sculpturatus]|uniref:uncharacterized protein LOC111619567 n=1 Tax=Centruroides sculpturatus TaxID=218467 RepID=UPI000C6EE186|nr:uncharacterized protein LOC111619567 [Centruroides sculpturatus]
MSKLLKLIFCFGEKNEVDELDSCSEQDLNEIFEKTKTYKTFQNKIPKEDDEDSSEENPEVTTINKYEKTINDQSQEHFTIMKMPISPNKYETLIISEDFKHFQEGNKHVSKKTKDKNSNEKTNFQKARFSHASQIPKIIRSEKNDLNILRKHFLYEWNQREKRYVLRDTSTIDSEDFLSETHNALYKCFDGNVTLENTFNQITDKIFSDIFQKCEKIQSDRNIIEEIHTGMKNVLISRINQNKKVDDKLDNDVLKEMESVARTIITNRLIRDDKRSFGNNDDQQQSSSTLVKTFLKEYRKVGEKNESSVTKIGPKTFLIKIPEELNTSQEMLLNILFEKKSNKRDKS